MGKEDFFRASKLKKNHFYGVPIVAHRIKNPTSVHEDVGSIPGLSLWVRDLVLSQVQCRSQTQLGSGIAVAVV